MRNKIHKFIKEAINPRLTTSEMETSGTRCGCDHRISAMDFGDQKPHFPTSATGAVNTGQGWNIVATWDRYGECSVNNRRIRSFDIITPAQKEIDDAKPVFLFLFIFILFIIITIVEK